MRVRDALDNIADAIRPGIVPRPIAKGLILFLGASFVWSLVQKVNALLTIFFAKPFHTVSIFLIVSINAKEIQQWTFAI